jgi:hypothetical protein
MVEYELATEERPGYLFISVSGDVYPGIARAVAQDVFAAYEKTPLSRLLVDVRRTHISVGFGETVGMVADYHELGRKYPEKTAVLYSKSDEQALRFYVVVAHNRGYTTQAFTDLEQAVAWLCGPGQSK